MSEQNTIHLIIKIVNGLEIIVQRLLGTIESLTCTNDARFMEILQWQ